MFGLALSGLVLDNRTVLLLFFNLLFFRAPRLLGGADVVTAVVWERRWGPGRCRNEAINNVELTLLCVNTWSPNCQA